MIGLNDDEEQRTVYNIIVGGQTRQAKPEKERVGRSPCWQQASGNNAGNTNVHQLVVWR